MNKQKPGGIGWCNYTWGPVTGCWGPGGTAEKPNRCSYCYAARVSRRFGLPARHLDFDTFAPHFHPERLDQPAKVKRPSKIFVCSMADLFGDWVPDEWICRIISEVLHAPQHTFQFLTKNPKRLGHFIWPKNAWVGTTVTNQADADERLPWLLQVDAKVRFVSHEPLLGKTDLDKHLWHYSPRSITGDGCGWDKHLNRPRPAWAIIGAMTGPGAVRPECDWVMDLAQQYKDAGVPLYLKDNLGFKDQPQEFPA